MKNLAILLVFFGWTSPAVAEESTRNQFNAFFEQVIGTWDLSIRDFDESGAVTYEGIQTRTFSWAIGNRYVQEDAYVTRDSGEVVHLGLMLYSFDEADGAVYLTSFWPRSPRRWSDYQGKITTGEAPKLVGVLHSFRPDGEERVRQTELGFHSVDKFYWHNYGKNEAGEEYMTDELIYSRRREAE